MIDLDNTNIIKPCHQVVAAVDDEEMVTISIKSYLELETDYRVLTFQSSVEALKKLKIFPPDIVISDFLMPAMDGLQFYSRMGLTVARDDSGAFLGDILVEKVLKQNAHKSCQEILNRLDELVQKNNYDKKEE